MKAVNCLSINASVCLYDSIGEKRKALDYATTTRPCRAATGGGDRRGRHAESVTTSATSAGQGLMPSLARREAEGRWITMRGATRPYPLRRAVGDRGWGMGGGGWGRGGGGGGRRPPRSRASAWCIRLAR